MSKSEIEYRLVPLKAIRDYCKYGCCNGDRKSWKDCPIEECSLYPFREGVNPFRKRRVMSVDERELASRRLEEARVRKRSEG